MSRPDISVVIPFHNCLRRVNRCLASLAAQKVGSRTFEIIAVDNASTDGTIDLLRAHPDVRVVECATRGPAATRNAGLQVATAPIVAFIDSDCIPHPRWLRELTRPLEERPNVLAAGGRIRALRITRGVAWFAEEFRILNQERFFRAEHYLPPFLATASAAFRRHQLLEIHGFDESLWMCEDADLMFRLLDRFDGALAYCPRAVVRHQHRETFRGFYRQALDYGAGASTLCVKHRDSMTRPPYADYQTLLRLGLAPVTIPWTLLTGQTPFLRKWALYEALFLTGHTIGRWKVAWKYRLPRF